MMRSNGMLVPLIGVLGLVGAVSWAGTSQPQEVVTQAEADQALRDVNERLTQERAVPHFENGQPDGYTPVQTGQGGSHRKLGLKNGDVIRAVDGQSVSDPQQAFKMMSKLRETNQLEVVRDGRDQVIQEQ